MKLVNLTNSRLTIKYDQTKQSKENLYQVNKKRITLQKDLQKLIQFFIPTKEKFLVD
jgi:hypothetical protein